MGNGRRRDRGWRSRNEQVGMNRPTTAFRSRSTVRCPPRMRGRRSLQTGGGQSRSAGGIAVRLTSPDNYYVVRANALEDNVNFYSVIKGRRTELKSANAKVSGNEWHTLALKAEGEQFTVTFDGKQLFTATDRTIAGPGRVGLWTKADSITRFDRIDVTPLP